MNAMKFKQLQFTSEEIIDSFSASVDYNSNIDENYNLNYMIREYDATKLIESPYATQNYPYTPYQKIVRNKLIQLAYNAQKNNNQYFYEVLVWAFDEYSEVMAYCEDLQSAISIAQKDMQDKLSLFLENV